LRSLDVGTERAAGEIATRAETVLDLAFEGVRRLERELAGDAAGLVEELRARVSGMRDTLVADAKSTVDECARAIEMVGDRADALSPRTVLAAGYAILRDGAGLPLTTVAEVRDAGAVVAEMRDGTAGLIRRPD
jgi:exodeoxyribonuclease VII large subunit